MKVVCSKGVRYPEPRLYAIPFQGKSEIDIGDIRINGANINRGYGSVLIKELIKISEKVKVRQITGWISPVEWDHTDRLKHFYEKNGFKVNLDKENKNGKILYEIDDKR